MPDHARRLEKMTDDTRSASGARLPIRSDPSPQGNLAELLSEFSGNLTSFWTVNRIHLLMQGIG